MNSSSCLLRRVLLGLLFALPLTATAQFRRQTPVYPDPYAQQNQAQTRQALIAQELQCLVTTTSTLQQSFAEHCRQRRVNQASPEYELLQAITSLNADVGQLYQGVQGRAAAQMDLARLYRLFHMVEYSSEDSQTVAYQTGYGRSLGEYFRDIDSHIESLGENGFRNPRLKRIETDGRYGHRHGDQERHVALPPLPTQQVQPGVYPNGVPPQGQKPKVDLGDLLGRIFSGMR
ncbi:MAG: hypothetical protein IPK32_14180 [Verrucomicrobiaceae bacterium]|nr:hypothetical protein [Verrucomicrobiaceae bacterium]